VRYHLWMIWKIGFIYKCSVEPVISAEDKICGCWIRVFMLSIQSTSCPQNEAVDTDLFPLCHRHYSVYFTRSSQALTTQNQCLNPSPQLYVFIVSPIFSYFLAQRTNSYPPCSLWFHFLIFNLCQHYFL